MGKTVGLTLGKYAPLHSGHSVVIETALRECDRVVVLIYDCPDVTNVPLNVRADWIRSLYPAVQVVEAWDGPQDVGDAPEIQARHDAYLRKILDGEGDITHFYSSEFYGEATAHGLGAVNRVVDQARKIVPISATAIRQNPFAHRSFLSPTVYRDLVTNVVFLGAPSTGKTTLAERMAHELETVWMPEYGREYWEANHIERRLSPTQLVEIAEGHLLREEALLQQANRYLFADTNARTTRLFALDYHGRDGVLPRLAQLADQCARRYDLVFVCDTDIPYADTWDRSGDVHRETFQRRVLADLATERIPYFLVQGSAEMRVRFVRDVLARHVKYGNLLAFARASVPNSRNQK